MEDPLYTDPSLVAFYDAENDGGADHAFCAALARGVHSVLDLGCGTGALLAGLSNPVRVGVDPAGAMLDVARARPGGGRRRMDRGGRAHAAPRPALRSGDADRACLSGVPHR